MSYLSRLEKYDDEIRDRPGYGSLRTDITMGMALRRLIREVKGTNQCNALNATGYRCHRLDTKPVQYHGDTEIYNYDGPEPTWVRVYLCGKHRKGK